MKKFLPFLFFLLFPIILLGDAPFATFRYVAIVLLGAFMVVYSLRRYSLSKLGLSEGLQVSHLPFILSSFLLALLVFVLRSWLVSFYIRGGGLYFLKEGPSWLVLSYYLLVSAPFQELVYRSFLVNFLEELRMDKKLILLIGAILFALMHIAWGKNTALGAFWLGSYWVWLFVKARSFWLLYISHLIIGGTAVFILYSCC